MSERTVKAGGVAGLLAAVLCLASTGLAQVVGNPDVYASPGNYLVQALNAAGFLAAVVAIIGLYALLSRTGRFRRLGLVGAGLLARAGMPTSRSDNIRARAAEPQGVADARRNGSVL